MTTLNELNLSSIDIKKVPSLKYLLSDMDIFHYDKNCKEFDRRGADGFFTIIAKGKNNKSFGVIYNDFKVNGGSFGREISKKLTEFIKFLDKNNIPLIILVNSMGVRLMEGRSAFADAFSIIPALLNFKKNNLLIAGNMGRCLGLGALIYGLANYRFSLREKAIVNLTGPEVIKLFFGESFDYAKLACANQFFKETDIIHEMCSNKAELLQKCRNLALFGQNIKLNSGPKASISMNVDMNLDPEKKLRSIIQQISSESIELFSQLGRTVRIFLIKRNGELFGLFINPPGNQNNMMTAESLKKYDVGFDFFKALKLPVVSMLDTPGAHPVGVRCRGEDVLTALIRVTGKIIDYEYGKLGCIMERSFGGASVLSFPEIFGSDACLAIKGSHAGIMDKNIIGRLLGKSDNFLEQWKENSAQEKDDYSDLIAAKVITKLIDWNSFLPELDNFLMTRRGIKSFDEEIEKYTKLNPMVKDFEYNEQVHKG